MQREAMPNFKEFTGARVYSIVTPELGLGFGAIGAERFTDDQAEAFAEEVSKYLVQVNDNQPSRCIDGRPLVNLISGDDSAPRPSIAGGAGMTTWVSREILNADKVILDDAITSYGQTFKQLEEKGLPVGGHCDSDNFKIAFDKGKTGCGAADRAKDIVEMIGTKTDFINKTASDLLGDEYDQQIIEKVYGLAGELSAGDRLNDWQGADMLRPVKDNPERTEILKSEHDSTHGHHEQAVVFNFINDTTVDRDRLVDETGKQVFIVDMWYLHKLAKTYAKDAEQAKQLLHAMVAYQIATYLVLCDGTHRAIIVK